ncbi:hypothetical protein BGZ73_002785 [Actinomortierella ambigua]|nr:hypothetical protein BGZ73_002785 [Actinomortierella ambigua]
MDSPLATELNALVLEKLNEYGWTDNEVLANFIVVMIANGKSKDEITAELAETVDFATWLFDRMDAISNQTTTPQIQAQQQPPQHHHVAQQQPVQESPVDQISFDDVQDDDYSSRHETRRDREMRDRSMSPARPSSRLEGGPTTRGSAGDRDERIRFRRTSEERRQDQQRSIDERLGTPRDSGRRGGRSIDERLGSRQDSRHESDSENRRSRRGGGGGGRSPQTQEEADRNALRSIESRLGRRRDHHGNQDSDYFGGEDLPKHPKSWSKDPERMLLAEAELTRQSIADHTAKQVRCKFWPNCQSGDQCRFWHPKELCQAYPNCPNSADTCLFVHPLAEPTTDQLAAARRMRSSQPQESHDGFEDTAANGDEMGLRALRALGSSNGAFAGRVEDCKFGLACTRPGCTFRHPGRSMDQAQQQCRYYPNCTKPNCPFYHPPYGEALSAKDASMGDANAVKPVVTRLPIPCRFGNNCTRPDCHFTHPRDGASNGSAMDQDGSAANGGVPAGGTAAAGTNGATTSQMLMPICKFNAGCTRADCKFRHTVMRPLLQQQQQKVSTAERFGQGLIVDESQVEKMPVPASAHWATGGVSHQPQPSQQQQQLQSSGQPAAPPADAAVDASMEMDMDL